MKKYFIARLVMLLVNAAYNGEKWGETNADHYKTEYEYFEAAKDDTRGIITDLFGREVLNAWYKGAKEIAQNTPYHEAFELMDECV